MFSLGTSSLSHNPCAACQFVEIGCGFSLGLELFLQILESMAPLNWLETYFSGSGCLLESPNGGFRVFICSNLGFLSELPDR